MTAMFTDDLARELADAAADIYRPGAKFDHVRSVNKFSVPGELRAGVREMGRTAIVAVRGTEMTVGNWIFTDFQGHYTKFRVIDEQLAAAPARPLQAGRYRTPLPGSIHQGFARAFCWLWYGTEPLLGDTERTPAAGKARMRRYLGVLTLAAALLLAFVVVLVALKYALRWNTPAAVIALLSLVAALSVALVVLVGAITLESGVWEDIWSRPLPSLDRSAHELAEYLASFEKVIFTGHSLGGAIATIAFSVYSCWCRSNGRKDNAYLCTFGAPRVGNAAFARAFARKHVNRFEHIVHPGDPVPAFPASSYREIAAKSLWKRGWLGAVGSLLSIAHHVICALYRSGRAAPFQTGVSAFIADARFDIANHYMTAYHSHIHQATGMVSAPHVFDACVSR
jgi:hypothetical protein